MAYNETCMATDETDITKRKLKIMVVDDECKVCDAVRRLLGQTFEPVVIVPANDGRTAIEMLDETFDLLVLDLGMPGIRGEGVALANELKGANVPIILITGESSPDLEFVGETNLMGILYKPFDPETMVKAVRAVLSGEEFFENR